MLGVNDSKTTKKKPGRKPKKKRGGKKKKKKVQEGQTKFYFTALPKQLSVKHTEPTVPRSSAPFGLAVIFQRSLCRHILIRDVQEDTEDDDDDEDLTEEEPPADDHHGSSAFKLPPEKPVTDVSAALPN